MKTKFYKSASNLQAFCISTVLIISMLLLLLWLSITGQINLEEGIWISIIPIIGIIITIIEAKNIFTRISISEKGVESKFLKKIIFIKWDEITKISEKRQGLIVAFLLLSNGKDKIMIQIHGKMYEAIMILCPNPDLKFKIQNLDSFKLLKKRAETNKN